MTQPPPHTDTDRDDVLPAAGDEHLTDPWNEVVPQRPLAGPRATLVRRLGARILDLGLWAAVYALDLLPWWVTIAAAAIWLAVPVWLGGATLGKRLFGIRVVRASGDPLALGRALLREALVLGSIAIPLVGVLDVLVAVNDPRTQALHDKVVGTLVVRPRTVHDG